MSAIITIDYRHYLVTDSKKALTVVQILNASKRVEATGYKKFTLTGDSVDVSMTTLTAKDQIKSKPAKKAKP